VTQGCCHKESVLVVVLAETRAYEHTFNLFKKNLLDIVNADLCLCVANNPREVTDNPFYNEAKYIWTYDEPDDWGDAFDRAQEKYSCHQNWRQLLLIKDQWLGGVKGDDEHPGSAGILLFFRWFLKESILNSGVLQKYDRFVITRSDFIHCIPHVPLKFLSREHIWIPNGEDYGGYTDRHIVVSREHVLDVLSISDRLITEPDHLFSEMSFYSKWNVEKYIKFSFTRLGLVERIRRFPYTMYSVRSIGGHSRWSEGKFSSKFGYYIKYQSEYRSYILASLFVKEKASWSPKKIMLLNALQGLGVFCYKVFDKFKDKTRAIRHPLRFYQQKDSLGKTDESKI